MADSADYGSLPFEEAISYFRQKVPVKSPVWADILGGAHTRAFTVAAATKDGMLTDFRAAIDKAIADGTGIDEFRRDFDTIVQKYGWDYNGGRGWRTKVIYDTNLRTAYAAGRWKQMTDPDVLAVHPYWRYVHADGEQHPRPEHLAWNGLTLSADDSWWSMHYPPNGWGCQCSVEPITRDELHEARKSGPDTAPPVEMRPAVLNTSAGPITIQVPKGIDPGWGYSVGEAAYGKRLPAATMDAWRRQGNAAWERLPPSGDRQSAGRPETIPVDPPTALGPSVATKQEMVAAIEAAIGARDTVLELPNGDPVHVNADALADHVDPHRAPYIAYLPEIFRDPYEVWLSFERHKGTGQVVLRKRILKAVGGAGRERGLTFVAQAAAGQLEAWTLVPGDNLAYLQRQRVGTLLWGRDGTSGDRPTGAMPAPSERDSGASN